jgi:hypothetical protein
MTLQQRIVQSVEFALKNSYPETGTTVSLSLEIHVTKLTQAIEKDILELLGDDLKEIEEPTPEVWQAFNEMERMDYVINRSIRKAINQYKSELRLKLKEYCK